MLITQYLEHFLIWSSGPDLKKKTWLYFELMICDKYRGKNTGPRCVNGTRTERHNWPMKHRTVTHRLTKATYSPLLEVVPEAWDCHLHQYLEAGLVADGTSAADVTAKSRCTDCYRSAPSHLTPDMRGPGADPKQDFNIYSSTDTSQFKYIFQLITPTTNSQFLWRYIQQTKWKRTRHHQLLVFLSVRNAKKYRKMPQWQKFYYYYHHHHQFILAY
jgi:hypothetical protein